MPDLCITQLSETLPRVHHQEVDLLCIFSDSKAAILFVGSTETVISTEAKDCQVLIQQLKAKHKQTALQLIPGHSRIAGNEYADKLAKKGRQNHTNTCQRNILPFYQTTLKTSVPKCVQTRIRDKAISKNITSSVYDCTVEDVE